MQTANQLTTDRAEISLIAYVPTILRPASLNDFNLELLACLTLCAPSGMSEDQRVEWVKVARATIGKLPVDLLRAGCEEARKRADHPAKIVPIILSVAEPLLRSRRETAVVKIVPIERRVEGPVEPIPTDEIRTWPRSMAETALGKDWITQSQFNEVFP